MSQKPQTILSDEEAMAIAIEFEEHEFTHEELVAIAATRRSTPRPIAERPAAGDDGQGCNAVEDGSGNIAPARADSR